MDGRPLPANLSLSVVDDKLWTFADDRQDNLLSWLLFSSELRGKVEEPAFYFKENEPQAIPALDLVMLTHGYRYFEPVPAFIQTGRAPFALKDEYRIIGAVFSKNRVPLQGKVFLYHAGNNSTAAVGMTDSLGRFEFKDISPRLEYSAIAGPFPTDSGAFISIYNQEDFPEPPVKHAAVNQEHAPAPMVVAPAEELPAKAGLLKGDLAYNIIESPEKFLQDVVVIGYGLDRKQSMTGSVTTLYSPRMMRGVELTTSLQGVIAGIEVTRPANPLSGGRAYFRGNATLSGNNEPLVLINGMTATMSDVQQQLPDIANVTVLKDIAATAIYGARAANGVILVNTNLSTWDWKRFRLYKPRGFAVNGGMRPYVVADYAEKFYHPYYESGNRAIHDDFRETIFWDPTILTDAKGEATVSFRNSDANTTFRMIAEGIGYEGTPGRAEETYAAAARISAEMRVPKELLSGDTAILQMHLRNNGGEPQRVTVKLEVPAWFIQLPDAEFTDSLQPGVLRVFDIPVVVKQQGYGEIVVITDAGSRRKDRKSYPITARERGFPYPGASWANKRLHIPLQQKVSCRGASIFRLAYSSIRTNSWKKA